MCARRAAPSHEAQLVSSVVILLILAAILLNLIAAYQTPSGPIPYRVKDIIREFPEPIEFKSPVYDVENDSLLSEVELSSEYTVICVGNFYCDSCPERHMNAQALIEDLSDEGLQVGLMSIWVAPSRVYGESILRKLGIGSDAYLATESIQPVGPQRLGRVFGVLVRRNGKIIQYGIPARGTPQHTAYIASLMQFAREGGGN